MTDETVIVGVPLTPEEEALFSGVSQLAGQVIDMVQVGRITLERSQIVGGFLFIATDLEGERYMRIDPQGGIEMTYGLDTGEVHTSIAMSDVEVVQQALQSWIQETEVGDAG